MPGQFRVLHVDDNPDVLDLSERLLSRREGLATLTAENATEGFALLETEDVDCIVSDSMVLPDGEPFVSAARERAPEVPIVLFTARPWDEISNVAMTADVSDYIQKGGDPSDHERLCRRVRALVAADPGSNGGTGAPPRDDPFAERTERGGRGAGHPENDLGDGWLRIGLHDWDTYSELGSSIVLAFEAYSGEPAEYGDPLFETVDPDALEELLRPGRRDSERSVSVRFPYQNHEVAVWSDGTIAVRARSANKVR